jgi:hypothetical protein
MTKFLLTVHVLAAIITIGPVTVAASMLPPSARRALAAPAALVLPRQSSVLAALDGTDEVQEPTAVRRTAGQLGMYTGAFNLLWATVTVLMIVRPGSTTGA